MAEFDDGPPDCLSHRKYESQTPEAEGNSLRQRSNTNRVKEGSGDCAAKVMRLCQPGTFQSRSTLDWSLPMCPANTFATLIAGAAADEDEEADVAATEAEVGAALEKWKSNSRSSAILFAGAVLRRQARLRAEVRSWDGTREGSHGSPDDVGITGRRLCPT